MENRAPNRVLVLYGGWKGHSPKKFADYTRDTLLCNYEVVCTQDLRMLHRSTLSEFDLILPIWTFGKITVRQEKDLLESVADGLGYVGVDLCHWVPPRETARVLHRGPLGRLAGVCG